MDAAARWVHAAVRVLSCDVPDVVVTVALPPEVEALLRTRFRVRRAALRDMDRPAFLAAITGASGLVVAPGDRVDAALIAALPDAVRIVASYSAGLDHIDVAAAAARGIRVTGTPDVLTDATADIALALIIMVVRGVMPAAALLASGSWMGWRPDQVFGRDLAGLRLGILGPGRIGRATARRAAALGLSARAWAPRRPVGLEACGIAFEPDWARFLAETDVLSLHAPLTEATAGLVDALALATMPRGSYLVNTSRGGLVDDDAVVMALRSGQLSGVGLDVFATEPTPDPRYLADPRAVLLPHMGSASERTRLAMGEAVLRGLEAVLTGSRG